MHDLIPPKDFDTNEFSHLLWGDVYFNEDTRKFQRDPPPEFEDPVRTFVAFILEPIYKLIGHTVGEEKEELMNVLAEVGVNLPRGDFNLCTKDLLKSVGRHFFQGSYAFVDAIVEHVRDPMSAAEDKTKRIYTGIKESFCSN